MNFDNIPLVKSTWGFTVTLLLTTAGCVYLYRKLKQSGWL
jgi:magnesium transporter